MITCTIDHLNCYRAILLAFVMLVMLLSCKQAHYTADKIDTYADSLCMLHPENEDYFVTRASRFITNNINDIYKEDRKGATPVNEVLYVSMGRQTGDYNGVSLRLNDSFLVSAVYKFSYVDHRFKVQSIYPRNNLPDLKGIFSDLFFYRSRDYVSDGSDEMLICRSGMEIMNGLFYSGCSTRSIESEKLVVNRNMLKLLVILRKQVQ